MTTLNLKIQERERTQLENERETIISQLTGEKDNMAAKFSAEREELVAEIAAVQRDRDEQLLAAENQRQEVSASVMLALHCYRYFIHGHYCIPLFSKHFSCIGADKSGTAGMHSCTAILPIKHFVLV